MKQAIFVVAVTLAVACPVLPSSAESGYEYTERTSIWVPATDGLPANYPRELLIPETAPVPRPVKKVEAAPRPLPAERGFNLLDRLEVGTRVNYFILLDDSRDITESFLGSITTLEAEQNYYPNELFASFSFTDWLALEAGYEKIIAKTVTENDKHSDGIFIYDGPVFSLVGRMANDTVFTPFVSLGAAIMSAGMKHNPVWHYGFGGTPEQKQDAYEAWRAAGSPPDPNGGRTRTLEPQDETGMLVGLGCDMEMTSSLSVQVYGNYMALSAKTHYYLATKGKVTDDRGYTSFPLDNVSVGFGLKYCF